MKIILSTLLFLLSFGFEVLAVPSWHHKIFDVASNKEVNTAELIRNLTLADIVVLGEKHYTPAVQDAEAEVVKAVGSYNTSRTILGWEFLNATSQDFNRDLYNQFFNGSITALEFLKITQGSNSASPYAPVLEAIKSVGGQLFGLNLSRAEKLPVVKGGIKALDPQLLPKDFEMGGQDYFERFQAAMAGHATPAEIYRYFEAQCLTDDVMAYHIVNDYKALHRILIAGSFHTDFFDGTVERIYSRAPDLTVVTVKVVDSSDYSARELSAIPLDNKYGAVADYVFYVNEPKAQ